MKVFFIHQKVESIQYKSALVITGAIRETSTNKFYNKLDLEPLDKIRWYRKYAASIKLIKVILLKTLSALFSLPWVDITQEIQITFLKLK